MAFETVEKLGEGGMGAVYAVRDRRLGREAALKLLNQSDVDSHARERFLREATTTARLDHPAIPPVYETGLTPDGQLYMLMRRIRGKTFGECIRDCHERGEKSVRELIEILLKAAEAVAYAHQQGIVHRDLKPDNIMVGEFGEVLVIDWGIAKDLASEPSSQSDQILRSVLSHEDLARQGMTVAGSLIGTPGYMSPEQIEAEQIDQKADIFALGVILVEALTGERAVPGASTIELIAATVSGTAMSPRAIDSSISKDLDWIAQQALQVDPERRVASVDQFIIQLKATILNQWVPGCPYSPLERLTRTLRRRSGTLALTAGAAFAVMLTINLWQAAKQAEQKRIAATKKLDVAERDAERAKQSLSLFNVAKDLVRRGSAKERVLEAVEGALEKGGRSEAQLLTGAQLLEDSRCFDEAIQLLKEAVDRFPPCYAALYTLHVLSDEGDESKQRSPYLTKLIEEAKKRNVVNEFTLISEADQLRVKGDFRKSLKYYNRAETYSKSLPILYVNRAAVLVKLERFDQALKSFARAIELNPKYYLAYYNRALLQMKQGQLEEALRDLDKCSQCRPGFLAAFYNRAIVYQRRGERSKAYAEYEKALQIRADFFPVLLSRGRYSFGLKDFDRAQRDFDRILALRPDHLQARLHLGMISLERKNYSRALKELNQVLTLTDDIAEAYFYRAQVWIQEKSWWKALGDLDKALERDPKHQRAYYFRAIVRDELGQRADAEADLTQSIQLAPDFDSAYRVRGRLRSLRGDYESAHRDLDEAIHRDPKNASLYFGKGLIYQSQGDAKAAFQFVEKALSLDSKLAVAYLQRGVLYGHQGQHVKALEDFKKALDLKCRDPLLFFHRGSSYRSLGRIAESVRDAETFLNLAPNHPIAPQLRRYVAGVKSRQAQGDR